MTAPGPILLADLEEPIQPVTLPNGGRTLEVRPLDSFGAQLASQVPTTDAEAIPYYWRIVKRCTPDITDEELEGLTIVQLDFIVTLASRQKSIVEQYLGKSKARTGDPAAGPSPSGTPSDGSSAGSPSTRGEASETSPSSPGTGPSTPSRRSRRRTASPESSAAAGI